MLLNSSILKNIREDSGEETEQSQSLPEYIAVDVWRRL